MLYKVKIELKGYVEYEIDAPSEEEAENVALDVYGEDPDLAGNLDVKDVTTHRIGAFSD